MDVDALGGLDMILLLEDDASPIELKRRLGVIRNLSMDQAIELGLVELERRGLVRRGGDGSSPATVRFSLTENGRLVRACLLRLLGEGLPTDNADDRIQPSSVTDASERATLEMERRAFEQMRGDLLSTVSHELRTPLTLIRTSVGLLLDSNPDEAMRQRLLRNIQKSSERMSGLVTDLLDLARLSSGHGELQLRYVDVCELASEAANFIRPLLEQKRQVLDIRMPPHPILVLGDHRRIEQVLLNLLSNAIKFSPTESTISIRADEEAERATIAISDTGPGIPAEDMPRLFEQFFTARTSSPSHNIGAGLGLPIAKAIVEAHGGHIWVESLVGKGTTFWFALPKEGPREEASSEDSGGR